MSPIISPTPATYLEAKNLFAHNELVAFPTETIYGLGANALSDLAAQKIFQVKGRPSDNPLIVHLGEKNQICEYAFIENDIQRTLITTLMPGPMTLLLPKKDNISPVVCAVPLVGIRLPSNEIAQKMLTTVGLPIAAPSANISGKASPTTAQMVYDYFGEKIPLIIDGGECEAGIESTVLRVVIEEHKGGKNRAKILILRPGCITKEDIEICFNYEIPVEYITSNPELSPGMRYKHYSISGKVVLLEGNPSQSLLPFTQPPLSLHSTELHERSPIGKKIGYLITEEYFNQHQHFFSLFQGQSDGIVSIRGTHKNLATCAHNLFDRYHFFEKAGVDLLFVETLPEVGIGYAIMNRVKRSAMGQVN